MVNHRRVERPATRQRRGPETRLTTQSESAKRRQLDAAALSQDAGDAGVARRRFSREMVRKRTKASELTAAARRSRSRQQPHAGRKRKRTSASSVERGALHVEHTADTQPELQVSGSDTDSEQVQCLQADTGVSKPSAQTQQAEVTSDTVSGTSLRRSQLRKGSQQNKGQGASASTAYSRQQHTAEQKASEKPAQDCHAPANGQSANEQPADGAANGAQKPTPDSPRSQGQQRPKGSQKRTYCKRTHGTPHPTFVGVKTSTAGVKHMTAHPDVKQIWSAYVMIPSRLKHKDVRMLFLGKNYWSAEAAARAVDRANIALHGREAASTNFPLEWYGPKVCDKPVMVNFTNMLLQVYLWRKMFSRRCAAFVAQECPTSALHADHGETGQSMTKVSWPRHGVAATP